MQSLDGTPICDRMTLMPGLTSSEAWRFVSRCLFPGHTLNHGTYSISLGADVAPHKKALISTAPYLSFMVEDVEGHGPHAERLPGVLRPALRWEIIQRGSILEERSHEGNRHRAAPMASNAAPASRSLAHDEAIDLALSRLQTDVNLLLRRQEHVQEALGRIEDRQLEERDYHGLRQNEYRVYSQWGEDGIIQYC